MRSWAGVGVNLTIRRGKGTQLFEGITQDSYTDLVVRLTPRENPPEGQGPVGWGLRIIRIFLSKSAQCSVLSAQ